ncbi:MAG: hypothetical protein KC438_14015 [Thermomicrobiales bacterium]|nr:hypothetical protein [Thermomicrobiales bacterium]MCO5220963.1 hypothetical protein [Thermomicrobiales bacterium]
MDNDRALHDRVTRHVANTRFPFPDQTDWPETYRTIVNAGNPSYGIEIDGEMVFPDIVIVDDTNALREMGEIETSVSPGQLVKWAGMSKSLPFNEQDRCYSFFIYVPEGLQEQATTLLETNEIPYAGVRSYRVESAGSVRVVPFKTPGAAKDHRE